MINFKIVDVARPVRFEGDAIIPVCTHRPFKVVTNNLENTTSEDTDPLVAIAQSYKASIINNNPTEHIDDLEREVILKMPSRELGMLLVTQPEEEITLDISIWDWNNWSKRRLDEAVKEARATLSF